MVLDKRVLAFLATIAMGAVAVGCGGDSGDDLTVAEAKSKLVADCQDDDDTAQQKKACVCIADELEKQGLTAKRIDELRKIGNDTESSELKDAPKEFTMSITACAAKLARESS